MGVVFIECSKERKVYLMATKAQLEGNKRYLATLDEIRIRVPKGRKQAIQDVAQAQGESLNGFVTTAIDERIGRLKSEQEDGE